MARESLVKKTSAIPVRCVTVKYKGQCNRLAAAASLFLMGAVLTGCGSSKLLDLEETGSPNTVSVAGDTKNTGNGATPLTKTAGAETGSAENIALQAPQAKKKSGSSSYPTLSQQPAKPGKTLSQLEKDLEIRELADAGKNHVSDTQSGLNVRAIKSAKNRKNADGGILGLGWLKSDKSKVAQEKMTPPERLRLSRAKAAASVDNDSIDNISTGSTPDLRRIPIIPEVPEKPVVAAKIKVANKTSAMEIVESPAPSATVVATPKIHVNRPSAQNPKMVFFSNGARKLTKRQQKPLNEVAKFLDNNGSNVYVLGFAQVVPDGNKEANIDSQDLAISRANNVANGLKKLGFPADQVVVQIIDEIQSSGPNSSATLRRVDVYFEDTSLAAATGITESELGAKKSSIQLQDSSIFEDIGN